MTIEIPPELEWVSYLAGSEWPQGDEDAMFRIGGHWRNSADDLAKLIPDLNRVRQETIDSLSGDTATAADEQFKMLFDGDYSVDKLVDAMAAVGDLAWDQGTQIEYTKLQVLSTLAIIAAEIAWAIYNSWETLGASLAWIPTFEGFGIAVIRQIANEFLKRIRVAITEAASRAFAVKALKMAGTGALHGVGIGLGQELAIQLYQDSEGHRHGINWGQVGKVALGGAVGGGVGALAHGPLATAFGPSNSIVGKAIKGTVVAFGSGVAGGVGGALAAGGGLDGKSIFGGAAGGAGSGAVHGAAGHGGEVHPGGGGPDGGPVNVPPPKVDVPNIDIKPDDVGANTNVPEPLPPHANVDNPPPTSSTAGPSDGGQDSGVTSGAGAGQNNGAGQQSNGASAGHSDGSGHGGARQNGAGQGNGASAGQNNGASAGQNDGSGQGGANQNGADQSNGASAGQNNGAGQQNNGASAGQNNGSAQGGANQNGADQSNGASAGQNNGSAQGGANQNGADQSNGASAGQNNGSGQQNNGASAGQNNGSAQGGANQNGAGLSNGASAGQNNGAGQGGASQNAAGQGNGASVAQNNGSGQQNNGASAGQNNGSAQGGANQNGADQSNGASAGQNNGSAQGGASQNSAGLSNSATGGQSNGAGQGGASQNAAGQGNGASVAQNNGSGQQNNGASAGQDNGSGQSRISQNGAGSNNVVSAAQNSGVGQQNNGTSAGQQSTQASEGSRPPGARPIAAGMDNRGAGTGATHVAATPHTDANPASPGTRNSASEPTGGPKSTRATPDSTSDGPQSNSISRPPSTSKPDAGREGSKPQEKDQTSEKESANPRTSRPGPQGSGRTVDGNGSRTAGTTDSSTTEKDSHDRSNAPKRAFIGSSSHERSITASSSAGLSDSGGTRASSPDVDPHRDGVGGTRASSPDVDPHRDGVGGTRASSPDVDPHRDGVGGTRASSPDVDPHRDGVGGTRASSPDVDPHRDGVGGTRASSPDVDPHRGGVGDDGGRSREEQVHSRPLPSRPDVDPHRGGVGDDGGRSREEQVHSRPLPSRPDVDPHRGGVGDDGGRSREEVVHSRPFPSPPDVPVLASLGGSNTSIHWIRSWIGDVNPGYDAAPVGDPRRRNCTSASLAVFHRLSGTSNDPAGLDQLHSHQVTEITDLPLVPTTLDHVEQTLRDAGPGSHTIVVASFDGHAGHAFNAYFDGRDVHGLDGQSGVDEIWPPDSYIFHPAHPPTQLFMGTPFHGTREQLMRGISDSSEDDSSSSRSGHDSGGPNRPSRAQIQGGHDPVANHGGAQPFAGGSGDHATRHGGSGQTASHGSAFAGAGGSHRSVLPGGGPGDAHGSDTPTRPHGTGVGGPGRDSRPGPIAGSDNGSGHRGGGVRDVSGRGLKRGRDDSGDSNSDVSRHDKRARMDIDAPSEVVNSNRHSDTDMDVDHDDHVDHVDPAAGSSRDTHAHAGSADDVEMADGTGHSQVDDLAVRLKKFEIDKKTEFNSKFADLVSTAEGTGSRTGNDEPGKNLYDDYVQKSVEENRPISFVVNAIVGADPVPDLKSFVDAVTNNAKDLHGKVAFVIGVNARNTPDGGGQASVDKALAELKGALDTIGHPVALTGSTWTMPSSGNVPFGRMRNDTLQSKANDLVIDALWSKGTHPYIAVQDFDTGSRNVPSGKHIFNHVVDSMTVGEGLPPSRPLMFGGGYRLGEDGKRNLVNDTEARRVRDLAKAEDALKKIPAEKKKLEADKKAAAVKKEADGIQKKIVKLDRRPSKLTAEIAKLKKAKNVIAAEGFAEDFERRINQDMDTRVVLAKTNPLLPYTPEPNLFVDAIATKLHSDIQFGDGAAEFSRLGAKLQAAYAKELGTFHDHQTGGLKDSINKKIGAIKDGMKNTGQGDPISPEQARALIEQDPELMNAMREIDNQRSSLEVDATNNRHPVRGEVFITDFKGAAVETDLTRLALGYAFKSTVPQSHTDLTGVADRFFDGKTAKNGTSVASFRDQFRNHPGNLREPTNLGLGQHGLPKRDHNPDDKTAIIEAKVSKEGKETEPAKTVKDLLGLHEKVSDQGETKEAKGAGAKKAAGGRGKKKETLDQGDKKKVGNPLNKSISTPVPSQDHGGVVAGISPQPKQISDEKTADHHKAFAAVNTAMSGPEALMQRNFGALGNIADLPQTLPPAKGGLFDAAAAAGPKMDPAALRQGVTNFFASLTSSAARTRVSTKLADFITDNPTTDGDLVNAIIQPGKPAAFVAPPGWGLKPDVQLHENPNPDIHPESTQDAGKSGGTADPNTGTDADKDAENKKQEADAENKHREADAETATNAERIAAQMLATTLKTPIHVQLDGKPKVYEPFQERPWEPPINVYATKQDNGRYTYSATAPAPARSARPIRPTPEPLAGGVGADYRSRTTDDAGSPPVRSSDSAAGQNKGHGSASAPVHTFMGSSPHRDGGVGGTRASSPDVDPHRDGGGSRASSPDVDPHRDSGGTRASSPDVDPHRGGVGDDGGRSREEVVHSRPLPSPPDVPVLASLGGSNTSIHWIRSWIGDVNPGYDAAPVGDPRRRNCTSASLAVFHRLSGTSNDPAGLDQLHSHQVTEITDLPLVPTTLDHVEQTLRDAGPGSHTIVVASFDGHAGHAFNAYFDGRDVHGLDGQSGVDEIWPPDSYIFHPAHPPTQLFMGTPFHGTREQLMRGISDSSEDDSSSSRSGHDSGGPNRPSRAQIQGGHDPVANHGGAQPFAGGSGDHATRHGGSGQTASHGSAFAGAGGSHRSVLPGGGPGDAHGSDTPTRPHGTGVGGPGRDSRPGPIAGSDNGSGHRGGGHEVSGGESGRGLKRGRDDSGDSNSDVSRHDKRARMDIDAAPEVVNSNRHSDTDMDVDHDDHVDHVDPEAGSAQDTHPRTVDGDDGMAVDHDRHDPAVGSSRDAHPHTVDGDDGMAVDHDRHDPAAGSSRDTHPHTAAADDVVTADDTGHSQMDELAGRLKKLEIDANTQFNSAFEELVSTKGSDSTTDNEEPGKNLYDDYVQKSVDEDRPVSFVVNAIVGAEPVPELKEFVDAVTNNAKDLHGKVAFVIGVNAKNTLGGLKSLNKALAEMKGVLDTLDHPVALVRIPWSSSDLKYGTLRNNTMHSDANRLVIDALWSKGSHPYIAVQDFDTGSRNVPSGKHIFNHVIDSMTVGDGWAPSRPLMFGGGYRLGDGGKSTLVAPATKRGGPQKKIRAEGFVEDFERRITQDMDSRVVQAKTNPLLPYTPEPNLFIDAITTRIHSDLKFGEGGSEFSQLGKKLQAAYASELGELHDKKIAAIDEGADTDSRKSALKAQELERLKVDAENNRHPIRGEGFITDFKGAAVETDLWRIAAGYADKHIVPQSHADLTGVADRFFDGKTAKKGTSPSGYRGAFPGRTGEQREPANLADTKDGLPRRKYTAPDTTEFTEAGLTVTTALGLNEGTNHTNRSISTPVPNHEDVFVGINPRSPDHKAFAAVNWVMSGPDALMQRNFGLLDNIANLTSTLPPAEGGLFHTVAGSRNVDPAELRGKVTKYVSSLREETDESEPEDKKRGKRPTIRGKLADYITDHPTTNGDLVNAIIQPGTPPRVTAFPRTDIKPTFRDTLDEKQVTKIKEEAQRAGIQEWFLDDLDRGQVAALEDGRQEDVAQRKADAETATNAEHIAAQILATTLNTPIHVQLDGEEPPTEYKPFGKKLSEWNPPITVHAVKQDNGRYTYSEPSVTSDHSAKPTRPAPTPSTSVSENHPHSSDEGALDPKVLHDNGPEPDHDQTRQSPDESPSEATLKAFGAQRSSLEHSFGAPGDDRAISVDHFGSPAEVPTADRGQQLVEARNAEERLEAGLSEGRQHIALLSNRLEQVDGQIAAQPGVLEEANRRVAGAVDHLRRLQDNERSIAEHGVDAMARQHAAELTRTQLSEVQSLEEGTRSERNSLVQLENELTHTRQHGELYQQRLNEVEAELANVGRRAVEASNVEQRLSTAVREGREHVTGLRGVSEQGDDRVAGQRAVVEDADRQLASALHDMQQLQDQVQSISAHGADAITWQRVVEVTQNHQLLVHRAQEGAHAQRNVLARLEGESALARQQLALDEQRLGEVEAELANAGRRTSEARTLEQQLSAAVLQGREQIAEIGGRVHQLDGQVTNQRHVVEEADHRLADARGVLQQLQAQERLIAERPVDENTRQRATEQTRLQQTVADAEQERARRERDSLERLKGESALMRQQLAHDEQRLAEVETQLNRARQDTAELARPQVVSREHFPEHSLEAIRFFRENYPQLRDLNAIHFNAGVQDHMHNCVNVVVSTFETLSGRRMVPHGAPSGRGGDLLIEHFDREHHMVSGQQEIVDTLVQAGPGSHGVVFQHRSQGEGHVFNALYDGRLNSVVFIDAQNGRLGSFGPNDRYGFMLVTGDDPHAPVPMDVDTTFGGPKADSTTVSHDSLTENNGGHGFGDGLDGRHRPSADGSSHKRRFELDGDGDLPEPQRGSASPSRSSLSGVPSAVPSRDSSGVPVARSADAGAGEAPNVRNSADQAAPTGMHTPDELIADEVHGPQHESVDVVHPTEGSGGGETPDTPKADAPTGDGPKADVSTGDASTPVPQLPARIGDHLVLGGTDVVEEFRSGEDGARDKGFEYIKSLVRHEGGGEEVWKKNEMEVYALFSDRGLRPEVPGMLRGGQTVKHVIHLTKNRSLTVELRLDGAHKDSKLEYKPKGEFKNEFEHTSDSTSSVGRSVQSRVVYHAGVQGNIKGGSPGSASSSAGGDTAALIASRAHDSGLTEVRTDRQVSGAQTAEAATRFHGGIQASIDHWFSDSPKVVDRHELAYHTQVAVPTRDVNDRGVDAPPPGPDRPSAPPRVEYTRALSGSDVVTNLWLVPDQHDGAHPAEEPAEPGGKATRGPRPQKIPEFVMDTSMRTAFEKAYGKGSADLAIEEVGKWLTVERLQANLHGMTNKQPLVLELESIPGARLEVHAFVEPLDTAADTKSAAGDGDVTNPKPAQRMMHPTGETDQTEFHSGTETDTSQVRQDAVTVTYQTPVPGRARGEGGTDTGEVTGGVDANMAHGHVHSDTESRQFRIRNTLKNAVAGQAWHGQARLRFVMHAPDAVSPSRRDAPFKGAVHETRARFDVLAEKSETTPTQDYTNQTVYAPPERIWGEPPRDRNSVAKSPWWRVGTGHRTVRMKDGKTRAAHEPAAESIPRGDEAVPLRGLGSMDRVTNLDVSGLHGMLDSMGRRAFGNDWSNVRSEVSSWHHLNRIRAALPAMTQHSPLTRTKLSGANSKTKVSFTADIEQLTYKRTIKTLSSPSMEITEGSASTTERNLQVSAQGALGGTGGEVNGGSVLGEVIAGGTETVRDSERVRDQQRVAVGTKFDQPMAIFEGWVRLDGTMTGSKSTVHESGLFPVEIAIPLTELAGSRTHDVKLPPSFTRHKATGFIDEPRPKPPRDAVDQAPQPKNPFAPKAIGHKGGQPRLPSPLVRGEDGREVPDPGLDDAADGFKQLPAVKLPPPGWEWTAPERMEQPPEPPAHAFLGSWHPSDMLIGLDPASGLLEAMRHDLTPALGSSLDDAVDDLAGQFGPRVLAARLTHQSGQQWSHDIPVAGGKITVKVRPVREADAEYVGSSSKFETDLSIESQSSAAQGHGASLRTNTGFRVQIPIPHGSVSFGGQHSGSVRPRQDPGGTPLSGLNTPTYTGEIEHRVPVRTRATEAHDLFRQPIRFEITYEKHGAAKLLKDPAASAQPVRLNGVFSYPKKTPTAVDPENAGAPPAHLEVRQTVVKIRPHADADPTASADTRRSADEDRMATHVLESWEASGRDVFGEKWPSVRAELAEHVKTMAVQAKLGDYTRGETKTINLTSVRGGKVVLGAHLDAMYRADSNATTEFYSGGQQLLTTGVSKSKGNNWQGFSQAQADLLPAGDTVNVSALARLGGGVGSETQDTRTNNTATGTLFRKKVPTLAHVGTVTITAEMTRPGEDDHSRGIGSAKVDFVTRESPTDKQAHASYSPRAGIIQNDADGAPADDDEQRGSNGTHVPQRGLSEESVVRKLVDGRQFRSETLKGLHEHEIKDAGEFVDALTDTLVASKLGEMTRVGDGGEVLLVRHGNVRIYGRAAVQKLDFDRIEHEGGNAYVLNDVNQARVDQHTATIEGNARVMFGPHGELVPGVSAYLLAGGGVGGRGRVDATSSQGARVSANEKFARSHAVFDGTTRITLTVRDGETRYGLDPFDVHGPILIPESETHPVDAPPPVPEPVVEVPKEKVPGPILTPESETDSVEAPPPTPEPTAEEPKEEVPEEFWLGALAAQWAESGDEAASDPPRASLSAEPRPIVNRSRIPAGSPIARTVDNTPDVSRP